jgi:hypothetical protein
MECFKAQAQPSHKAKEHMLKSERPIPHITVKLGYDSHPQI